MRKLLSIAAVAALIVTGCGHQAFKEARGLGNSRWNRQEVSPAYVVTFPDHYTNIATKCVGFGHFRVFTASDGLPINWVVNDPTCPGGPQPGYHKHVTTSGDYTP